jgi:hypothetical protein
LELSKLMPIFACEIAIIMGQLAFLRMFILVAISLDVNDNRRHVHVFRKGMRHQHSLAKI